MSNPSLPLAPAPPPPPMAAAAASSRLLRRARDPDDDDDDVDEDALQEGELRVVPVLAGHDSSDSDDTEDDDDDDGRRYLFQPRVEYDDYASEARPRRPQHHRSPRRRPRRLTPLDILFLGPGAGGALPSPTPSGECESDATLSDDHHGRRRGGVNPTGSSSSAGRPSSSAAAAEDAVGRGWAATGKRGWKAGGNKNFVSLAKKPAAVVVMPTPVVSSDLNTVSAGDGQAGTTASISTQAAHHHHHQPPLPEQATDQPPRAAQPPPPRPRRVRERATEYTCKECGKSYPNHQALGGHAAGHKNKQREAAAMAAAAGGDGASFAAAFLPLRGGGGKADEPHECRKCGKVFGSGVALGGHMRVHYTGPPIVPDRKNKKRCLAPPPPPPPAVEGDIEVAAVAPAVGLSLALSIKTDQEPPPAMQAGGAVSVVRLFGIDINPQVQAPLQQQQQQQQQGSGGTTEDSSATGQQQH